MKFKPYRGGNESETSEGTFQVRKGKKVTTYKNQYLFEVQYLTPEIKRVEHRIHCIEQRRTRHEHELERIKSQIDSGRPSVCFGSRKLFKQQNTIYAGRHDEWLNAVSPLHNHLEFIRVLTDIVTYHKEGGFYVVFVKQVEYPRSNFGDRPVIESQIDGSLVRVHSPYGAGI